MLFLLARFCLKKNKSVSNFKEGEECAWRKTKVLVILKVKNVLEEKNKSVSNFKEGEECAWRKTKVLVILKRVKNVLEEKHSGEPAGKNNTRWFTWVLQWLFCLQLLVTAKGLFSAIGMTFFMGENEIAWKGKG
jgi:hypothetical protein